MTFEAHQANFVPDQHSRISRAVRLMAGGATFEANGGVLEYKWSTFVAVALEAGRLVTEGNAHALRHIARVRIVAIGARHGAFGETMFIGFLK